VDAFVESPTARALRTLELVQLRPGITSDELARRLGVTDRAVRRYVATLREAGVHIESERGPHGGYRVGRGARMPPLVFTASEALGLVMAVLDGHHAAADPDDPVGSALGKLIGSLPGHVGHQAAELRRHALAAPDRGAARPDPVVTTALVDAIAAQRGVRLGYRSQAGSRWSTEADPWAVVVRHGRWYLLCFAHDVGDVRTYRIDRIEHVETRNVAFEPPPDLDPVEWLERHLGTGWEYETHVVFDGPLSDVARYVRPPMGHLEPLDDGARCVLLGTTSNPDMYAGEWLAPVPFPFRVIGGAELRRAVAAVARRLTEAVDLETASPDDEGGPGLDRRPSDDAATRPPGPRPPQGPATTSPSP
jgi:predicted DNA-binding transcriptional regulator YafY